MTLNNRLRLRVRNIHRLVQSAVDHALLNVCDQIPTVHAIFEPLSDPPCTYTNVWPHTGRVSVAGETDRSSASRVIRIRQKMNQQERFTVVHVPLEMYWREVDLSEIDEIMVMSSLSTTTQPWLSPITMFSQMQAKLHINSRYGLPIRSSSSALKTYLDWC